jgi:hypothetical protein
MTATQRTFSAVDRFFSWTEDGWYEWDPQEAGKAALKERNAAAKAAQEAGYRVKKFSLGTQTLRRGGIGTGRPEIDFCAKVYGFNVVGGRDEVRRVGVAI